MRILLIAILALILTTPSVFSQIPFEKDGKWGIIDIPSNKTILKPKYSYIRDFKDGFAVVFNNKNKAGVINSKGIEVIPCEYDDIVLPFVEFKGSNFIWVKKGKWGLSSDKYKTKFLYDEIYETPIGVIAYLSEDYQGEQYQDYITKGWYRFIDTSGRPLDYVNKDMPHYPISDEIWLIGKDIYNSKGEKLYSGIVDIKQLYPNNFIVLKNPMTDSHVNYDNVIDKNTGLLIDSNKCLIDTIVCDIDLDLGNIGGTKYLCSYIDIEGNKKFALYKLNQKKLLIPFISSPIYYSSTDYTPQSGQKIRIHDFQSNEDILQFVENLLDDSYFGGMNYVIIKDTNGINIFKDSYEPPFSPIISGNFDSISKTSGGWEITESETKYIIDENGNKLNLRGAEYEEISPLSQSSNYSIVRKDNLYGLIDTATGETLIPLNYKSINRGYWSHKKLTVINESNQMGIYDIEKKKFIIPVGSFEDIIHNYTVEGNKELLIVEKKGKFGAFLDDGKSIVPIIHTGYYGWNGENKIFFDDDNTDKTGTTFYVYRLNGSVLAKQFFYNDQRYQFRKWSERNLK